MLLPYKLIKGNGSNIEEFETAVSDALMQGYEISSELVVHTVVNDGQPDILLLQPMFFDESVEIEDEDDYSEEELVEIEEEIA